MASKLVFLPGFVHGRVYRAPGHPVNMASPAIQAAASAAGVPVSSADFTSLDALGQAGRKFTYHIDGIGARNRIAPLLQSLFPRGTFCPAGEDDQQVDFIW